MLMAHVSIRELVRRRQHLPHVDPDRLRRDIDLVVIEVPHPDR
jgi:hypothetical protein